MATAADWRRGQKALNAFTKRHLKGVGPILVDGVPGASTRKRIRDAKFWLGYKTDKDGTWSRNLGKSLRAPNDPRVTSKGTVARGKKRRRAHNVAWVKSHFKSGVRTYDGVRVAAWLVPYLEHARANGWRGRLVSGWRDPAYSESLCYRMCGRPTCPGKCAGRSSNHAGKDKPRGALDVSDYYNFGRIIHGWGSPPIFNALGARDPVHFSATGN